MTAPNPRFDARTAYLLWRTHEACGEDGFLHYRGVGGWKCSAYVNGYRRRGEGATLADALTSLLADLGVTDPWPDEAVDEQTWEAILLDPAGMAQVAPVETLAVLFPDAPKETT